jgi:hypothetical protein
MTRGLWQVTCLVAFDQFQISKSSLVRLESVSESGDFIILYRISVEGQLHTGGKGWDCLPGFATLIFSSYFDGLWKTCPTWDLQLFQGTTDVEFVIWSFDWIIKHILNTPDWWACRQCLRINWAMDWFQGYSHRYSQEIQMQRDLEGKVPWTARGSSCFWGRLRFLEFDWWDESRWSREGYSQSESLAQMDRSSMLQKIWCSNPGVCGWMRRHFDKEVRLTLVIQ